MGSDNRRFQDIWKSNNQDGAVSFLMLFLIALLVLVSLCAFWWFSCSYINSCPDYTSFGILCPLLLPLNYLCLQFSLLSAIPVASFFPSGAKLISSIICSLFFLDVFGILLVSKNLEVVFLPPAVSSSRQNFLPIINAASSMVLFVETVTSNNIHSEFGSKKVVHLCCCS